MKNKTKPDIGKIQTFHLENGISLYVRENHAAPVATVQAWVSTGSIHEGKNLGCGLSHFLEHMMFQGSSKYSSEKIMKIVHENGGEMNAYTSFAATVYYIKLLSEATDKAVDILTDMIQTPQFKAKTFKTEKDVILREQAMGKDSPSRILGEKLWRTVFRSHPARHPIIGYSEQIETVDRNMMVEYHKERYTPDRIFFVISGDVNGESIAKKLAKKIEKMGKGNLHDLPLITEPEQKCMRHEVFHYDDPLGRMVLGYRIPEVSSQDIPALDLLSSILGHSRSSRLVKKIRNRKQLAINIDSYCYSSIFEGIFTINAAFQPEKREELKSAIFAEIKELSKGIKPSELEKVKKQLVTNLYRTLRSNSGIANIIGNSVLTYGTPDYACKYMEDIEKVTVKDILTVAEKYLDYNKLSMVEMLPTDLKEEKVRGESESGEEEKPQEYILRGKTKLIHLENNTSPLIDLAIILPGGTFCEEKTISGISRLTSRLLISGSESFSEEEFAELLDSNAIALDVSAGNNTITMKFNCHTNSLAPAIKAFESMISEPLFSEKILAREKGIAIESLKTRALSPLKAAEDRMFSLLYGDHPYANPAAGMEESINNLTIQKIKDFYFNTVLNRKKAIIGISGNITGEKAKKTAEKLISKIPWAEKPVKINPPHPSFPDKSIVSNVNLPKEQCVVMLGIPGITNTNPDRFAMDITQTALNGLSTRLFKSIRDDAGLAYYTGLYSSRGIHEGFIAFYAGTAPETAEQVVTLMNREKNKLASKGLTKRECKSALARLKGESASQKINPASIMFNSVLSEFYGNGYMEPWDVSEKYAGVTQKELNKIVRKYFSNMKTVIVTAGPEGK